MGLIKAKVLASMFSLHQASKHWLILLINTCNIYKIDCHDCDVMYENVFDIILHYNWITCSSTVSIIEWIHKILLIHCVSTEETAICVEALLSNHLNTQSDRWAVRFEVNLQLLLTDLCRRQW